MPPIVVSSYAKLNLYLRVAGLRPDGYHEIESVFERVSLHDTIRVTSTKDPRIRIRCRTPGIPCDEKNLCYKAALALKERFRILRGCEISLTKRIPAGTGMGGGSSNAAATLYALCRAWRLRLSRRTLIDIAAGIGSDVPFFCFDAPFALVTGRGEKVKPLTLKRFRLYHVIVIPPVYAATKNVYSAWDGGHLTSLCPDVTMILSALKRRDSGAISAALCNDLEQVAGKEYPAIPETRFQLSREPGCAGALMTGSGSAVFGVYTSKTAARSSARRFTRPGYRVFYAETC